MRFERRVVRSSEKERCYNDGRINLSGNGRRKGVKTKESPQVEVQERGEIFFFYRPKVNKDTVRNVGDVQRLFMVLRPESGENRVEEKQSSGTGKEASLKEARGEEAEGENTEQETSESPKEEGAEASKEEENTERSKELGAKAEHDEVSNEEEKKKRSEEEGASNGHEQTKKSDGGEELEAGKESEAVDITKQMLLRLIVIGRKSLPDASKRTRPYWGFVELVTKNTDDIKEVLSAEKYETATRGERENPPCRPVGEGIYRLVRHHNGSRAHTHLVYKLELPGPDEQHEPQEAFNIEPEGSYVIQIKNPEQANPPAQGLQNKKKSRFPARLQAQLGSLRFAPADPPDFLNYEGCELILISASDDVEEELGLELEGTEGRSDLLNLFGNWDDENRLPVKPLLEGQWA
ncbi:hypothetical protein R1flu_019882 [Riccia fluitans]|uniref:Uncharacterized protein n=1 Tax=Riccia fluitans TaxID=41844 RepID=A0ABD1ZNR5_9MARC